MSDAADESAGSWLYILRCRGDRLYTGVCLDLRKRWLQHCAGKGARFTRAFPPQSLAIAWYLDAGLDRAQRYERLVKALVREQKEALIRTPAGIEAILDEGVGWRPWAGDPNVKDAES